MRSVEPGGAPASMIGMTGIPILIKKYRNPGVLLITLAALVALMMISVSSVQTNANPSARRDRQSGLPSAPKPISRGNLLTHLTELQSIATAHGGTRAAGSPGYWATVRYTEKKLRAAGYTVRRQYFDYPRFRELAPAVVAVGQPAVTVPSSTLLYSASGTVEGTLVPTRSLTATPRQSSNSTSGCTRKDFRPAPSQNAIALVMRGTCFTDTKITNAEVSGYKAVIEFDDGQPEDDPVLHATAGQPTRIPAVGVSFATGRRLFTAAKEGNPVRVQTHTRIGLHTKVANVIADSRPARSPETLLLTGQLDSVEEGPGINDAGTGLSAILETAERLNQPNSQLRQRVRIVLFGAEEPLAFRNGPGAIGLLGNYHYTTTLPASQRRLEFANLNVQMLGSPNWSRYVLDGNGSTMMAGPSGSGPIEQMFLTYFRAAGLITRPMPLWPGADYGPLASDGIPIGGLFTGDGTALKTKHEQELFGGTAGQPDEPCYHQACDNLAHINTDVLTQMANALNHVAWQLAHLNCQQLHAITDPAAPGKTGQRK